MVTNWIETGYILGEINSIFMRSIDGVCKEVRKVTFVSILFIEAITAAY